ncbi:MAG: RsmD family RNA methyltransferase [Thaumarchaeota archaeon]|nr:RsmD family RNA methyltransferase [Nitrososphaerota archaeon]
MSPTALISEKLGIKWVMMFDDEYVYGPTPGIVEVAELLMTQLKPKTVIDLFGGSGALSKLALKKKVRKVIYVDLYPEAAMLNLKGHKQIEIVEQDALTFLEENREYCDLLLIDPPEELIDEVLSRIGRIRKMIKKAGLIWIGPIHTSNRRIRKMKRTRAMTLINAWGDSFMVTWKPGFGEKIKKVKYLVE